MKYRRMGKNGRQVSGISMDNVEQNAAALDIALTAAELARLSGVFIISAGTRYRSDALRGMGIQLQCGMRNDEWGQT